MLWPLYDNSVSADILMVELAPLIRKETPTAAKNILNRINEIASIHGLIEELRALETTNREAPDTDIRMHVLSLPDALGDLDMEPSIKRTVDAVLFRSFRRKGRAACDEWLSANFEAIGKRSSVDIELRYLLPFAQRSALGRPGVAAQGRTLKPASARSGHDGRRA